MEIIKTIKWQYIKIIKRCEKNEKIIKNNMEYNNIYYNFMCIFNKMDIRNI